MKCETCKYWEGTPAVGGGNCHRYAPRPSGERTNTTTWPRTDANNWCGEFRERP